MPLVMAFEIEQWRVRPRPNGNHSMADCGSLTGTWLIVVSRKVGRYRWNGGKAVGLVANHPMPLIAHHSFDLFDKFLMIHDRLGNIPICAALGEKAFAIAIHGMGGDQNDG
jgi:hypothetical protein